MTLRELLSCFDEGRSQRIQLLDREYREICLKICFNCDAEMMWVFEEDMEELEMYLEMRVARWYVSYGETLRIYLDADFEEDLK